MKNFEFFKTMEYLTYNAGEGNFMYESNEGRFNVENKTEELAESTNIHIESIGKTETFEKIIVKLNGLLGKKNITFVSEDVTATYTAKKKIITIHYRRNFENLKEMTYIVSAVKDMYSVEQIDISMMSLSKVTLKLVNDTLKITNVVFYTEELYLKYINEAKKEKSDGKVVLSENHTLEIDNLDTKESLFNVYRNKPEEYFTQNIKGFVEEINAGLKMALMSYIPENTEDYDVTDIAIISETRYIEEKKISLEKINQINEKYGILCRAEKGNPYYYINEFGEIKEKIENMDDTDNKRYDFGNYFTLRSRAEIFKNRLNEVPEIETAMDYNNMFHNEHYYINTLERKW